jgi:signal transduction histidine kinase/ligand-binding sensor domain-containing protein/DNA-binding response OmpR family regulator
MIIERALAHMFKKVCINLCCLLLAGLTALAQTGRVNFTSITAKDGLLSNSVNAILKDRQGLMWFATNDGLNKFDGTNFTVYRNRAGDSSSLRANEVLALHEDKKGNLWVGTSGGGLSLYNRQKDHFEHLQVKAGLPGLTRNAVIRSICSDASGKIWVAQFEGLYIVDPDSKNISKLPLTNNNGTPVNTSLICVFKDSRDRMWVGTDSGLFLFKRASNSFISFRHSNTEKNSLSSDQVRAIEEDKQGNLWVGTVGGLDRLQFTASGFSVHRWPEGKGQPLSNNQINCIAASPDTSLWVGTWNGLNKLNPGTGQVEIYTPEYGNIHSLTTQSIRCAYIDQQGIYWFGTFRGGINKYDKNLNLFNLKQSEAFHENSNNTSIVTSFAETQNGRFFIGTDGGGLYEFNRSTERIRPLPVRINGKKTSTLSILALQMTKKNELVMGTFGEGVIIYNPATGATSYLKQGKGAADLNNNDIFCLKEMNDGSIWVGTNGDGINVLMNNKVISRYTPRPNGQHDVFLPVNGFIRAIEEDVDGNIWIGSHGAGIAVLNRKNGKWTVYNQENSKLPSDKVQALLRDSHGRMWIGTYGGGLCLFNKGKNQFINFSEKDGLQNTTIYQIVEDLQGRIWLSSNTGISSFDVNTNSFRNFNCQNGVQNNNFVHGSGLLASNGELFFGGLQGFNYFDPGHLTINRNVPTVILTDLKISNKSVSAGDASPIKENISIAKEIRLEYKQNFTLGFVALNYTIPRQNHYAYKLEGFDKDWNNIGTNNTASYTNLDPGEYTFKVKAANNDGVWSTGETMIKIFVKPPFWRTTTACIFYVLFIGSLLFYSRYRGIQRLRRKFAIEQEQQEIRRMQELDRLKLKFLTNLSHDFRTPISLIMGPVDQLIAEDDRSNKIDKLYMIRRNARRLLNLVNQLLDFRKMEEQELRLQLTKGEFGSFVQEVCESFRDLSERKQIDFVFKSNAPALYAYFDKDKIERVLFNLLSNAFKFTLAGGHIRVALEQDAQQQDVEHTWVSIKVEDSGIGIPKDDQDKIFKRFFQNHSATSVLNQGTGIGLSITKEFIRMHGGTIDVESEQGKGTAFIIHMPLKTATEEADEVENPEHAAADTAMNERANAIHEATLFNDKEDKKEALSILLVEDNEDFRFYLKDNLRNNYKVLEAANGKEGWHKALANHPHLIVSDVSMPEMDGIALLKKLKGDKRTSHIPVILLTAVTAEEQQVKGLECGATDYITKPFNFEVLSAKIKNLLELKTTMQTTYTKQIKIVSPAVKVTSADEKLMHEITGYLEKNIAGTEVSVEALSREVGMSRSTLYVKLLEITGQTPVEYIRSYRLDKAVALMEKSNMTISEIAYQVGFTTPNYFARSFKSRFNMLPSEYIAKHRKIPANENGNVDK